MINPKPDDVGRHVFYLRKCERGIITSFNSEFVFVLYAGDKQSKATKREDLEWHYAE